ncbi:hypothetical protein [Acinetobacter bereziniae]|uniref:hypothetical protein n=1 Tax=Acinetobacter bereziniae TaxID=106648 RepID=UPI00125E9F46|nr:hypothetical protein [Acinetobacter bereziniae]
MNVEIIPTISDWGEIDPIDYDAQYTFDKYVGKSLDDMMEMLRSSLMERAFELQYMPDKVFNYYILGLKKYIEVAPLNDDTSSAVSIFFNLIEERVRKEPNVIKDVYPELKPILYHIANNQEKFDADVDIYGKFMDKYNFIESKMSKL